MSCAVRAKVLVTTPYCKRMTRCPGTVCDAPTLGPDTGHTSTLMLTHATMRCKNHDNVRYKPMKLRRATTEGLQRARSRLCIGPGHPARAPPSVRLERVASSP